MQTGAKVPIGRLRNSNLYPPVMSELLVGPILRSAGEVTWQPEGPRHGADYRFANRSRVLVAEVKRLWTARRQAAVARDRISRFLQVAPSHQGPVFTDAEHRANTNEDGGRLYRRVRHAAKQLAVSARNGARRSGQSTADVPGILFLISTVTACWAIWATGFKCG